MIHFVRLSEAVASSFGRGVMCLKKALVILFLVPCCFGSTRDAQAQSAIKLARKAGCIECHGFDKPVVGPSFNDVGQRYNFHTSEFDLNLMSVDGVADLPTKKTSMVVLANVRDKLHLRVFAADGHKLIDKSESQFIADEADSSTQRLLTSAEQSDGTKLSTEKRNELINSAFKLAGYDRNSVRKDLIEKIKNGSKGNWTHLTRGVPMPPFSKRLTDEQIAILVDWIIRPLGGGVQLKVMRTGLGSGVVTSNPAGINCGPDCDHLYSGETVTLTATPDSGSVFVRWEGDATGASTTTTVTMTEARSVRAVFDLATTIPALSDFTPGGIETFLMTNPNVNTPARFLAALPTEFKQNWVLMTRSESLQTGTAEYPRILLPSADARFVFTIGLATHGSYPGSHPSAVEFMQWDATAKNFRFHEIVLNAIPPMGVLSGRSRGVSADDAKCFQCHSTRNVLNRSSDPGTTGLPPRVPPNEVVKSKSKPNWDTYDSWTGMMPLNRDRIYKGSVEAAAFRRIFNLWTWSSNPPVREIIEQLELQPPGVPAAHVITRTVGGGTDGHINFVFDDSPPVLEEPAPVGTSTITTNYQFDGAAGTGAATTVQKGGDFITLHHSNIPTSDEGRGVRLFDALGGLAGTLNQTRIADELVNHRWATGSIPIDVRPIALAITKFGKLRINTATNRVESNVTGSPLTIDLSFFDSRNGMQINDLVADTEFRAFSIPRRKADFQRFNLHRAGDTYLKGANPADGLIEEYGANTSQGPAGPIVDLERIRQEVFRRPIDAGVADRTVMGGIYVDRELASNIQKVALFRYFLEPLGVSVDKWSMGVRGRSRTYSFADVFGTYLNVFEGELRASLLADPVPGLADPDNDAQLITAVNSTLGSLPAPDAMPKYTDIQRIFNKSCIECHGGLDYPPYSDYGSNLDLSEDESPPTGSERLTRAYDRAVARTTTDPATSSLYSRLVLTTEACPYGVMPCGGPSLSKSDIETIRRWILGPPSRPYTHGDPHIKTVEGIRYDFQAAGEFVLLRGQSVEIQARHTAVQTNSPLGPNPYTGLTSCVSINTAVAVRIGGHRITYQPNLNGEPDPDGLQLRVDGKLVVLSPGGIPLSSGVRIISTSAPGGIQIDGPGGSSVIATPGWWNHYQVWYLNLDMRHVRATDGLMGTIRPDNWLPALPDGSTLGPMPAAIGDRFDQLYGQFGNAWRVTHSTSLFDYAPGTSPKTFHIKNWPRQRSECTVHSAKDSGRTYRGSTSTTDPLG